MIPSSNSTWYYKWGPVSSLIFRQDLNPILLEQLKYFPTATHDDGPDALAGVVKSLATKIDPGQPLQRRRANRR